MSCPFTTQKPFKMEFRGQMMTVEEVRQIRHAESDARCFALSKEKISSPKPKRLPSTEYQVELVWNREFDFTPNGESSKDLQSRIKHAQTMENLGDGASVKKTRIVDEHGQVVWQYRKLVK